MASLVEFDTVRELEKKSSRVFMYGGGGLFAGLVLTFIVPPLGVALMALSALVVLGGIICVSTLAKEKTNPLFCPYCASKNDVYTSRRSFSCDICARPVIVDENGEPAMAQPIDLTARHNQQTGE